MSPVGIHCKDTCKEMPNTKCNSRAYVWFLVMRLNRQNFICVYCTVIKVATFFMKSLTLIKILSLKLGYNTRVN